MQLFLRAVGLASVVALAQAGRVQRPDLTLPQSAAEDRDSVVKIFQLSYDAYRDRCAKEISNVLFNLFSSLRLVVVVGILPSTMTRWHR
jgi:hypothetical protein